MCVCVCVDRMRKHTAMQSVLNPFLCYTGVKVGVIHWMFQTLHERGGGGLAGKGLAFSQTEKKELKE